MIPKQLQNPDFRFIKIPKDSKAVTDESWNKEGGANFRHDDPELLSHIESGGNYGIVGGFGNLVIVDEDVKEWEHAIEAIEERISTKTFGVKTASGGRHRYFIIEEGDIGDKAYINLEYGGNHAGEVRGGSRDGKRAYVVCPDSRLGEKKYEVFDGSPIAKVSRDELFGWLRDMIPSKAEASESFGSKKPTIRFIDAPKTFRELLRLDQKLKDFYEGDYKRYDLNDSTRSGAEMSLVTMLVRYGFDDLAIDKIMQSSKIGKWVEKPESYKTLTIKKARELIGEQPEEEKVEKDRPTFDVMSDEELDRYDPAEIKWYVDSFVPDSAIVVWGGKRSSFKTWAVLSMIISLATGKKFLNVYPTEPVDVLFMDEENGLDVLKERVGMIKKGLGISEPLKRVFYSSYSGMKIDTERGRKELEKWLASHSPCIVVTDSFRRVISAEENDATEMNRVFTEVLRPLGKKYKVSWILIHHARKGVAGTKPDDIMDELRGSSEIANVADSIIVQERRRKEPNIFVLYQPKSRRKGEMSPQKIEAVFEGDGSVSFEYRGIAEDEVSAIQLCSRRIMALMEEEKIFKFQTKNMLVAMSAENYSRALTERSIKSLVEEGILVRVKHGVYCKAQLSNTLNAH